MAVEINVWSWIYTENTTISRDGSLTSLFFLEFRRITQGFWPQSSSVKSLLKSFVMGGYNISFKAL